MCVCVYFDAFENAAVHYAVYVCWHRVQSQAHKRESQGRPHFAQMSCGSDYRCKHVCVVVTNKPASKQKFSFRNLRFTYRQAAPMQPTSLLLRVAVLHLLHTDPFLPNSDKMVFVQHPHTHTRLLLHDM